MDDFDAQQEEFKEEGGMPSGFHLDEGDAADDDITDFVDDTTVVAPKKKSDEEEDVPDDISEIMDYVSDPYEEGNSFY